MKEFLEISQEVTESLKSNKGVVALESTIISHGMPYPENAETAVKLEKMVRDMGCMPATIAILNGKLKAGLTLDEIEYLAKNGNRVQKCSRRDLPLVLSNKTAGATTVAATMIIAQMAGIEVFATGGIGGVHRGAGKTMDISADLQELARTDVTVVSAGAKAILDLGLTLEYLETYGVPVLGFQTDEFPAFYSRKSGLPVDFRVDDAGKIADIIRIKRACGLRGGILIANPIPEEYEPEFDALQKAITKAVTAAEDAQIKGKEITPWLLNRINALTGGESLKANIRLVENNVRLACDIVKSLTKKD
ncbi:MAG: pseudouridine-5'-phosphate glycosidase [Saprospiraceae bacterium]|nr:pseudouridine-5'-phosphate glycosidase [Saprospiraceae bacterium]